MGRERPGGRARTFASWGKVFEICGQRIRQLRSETIKRDQVGQEGFRSAFNARRMVDSFTGDLSFFFNQPFIWRSRSLAVRLEPGPFLPQSAKIASWAADILAALAAAIGWPILAIPCKY